MNPNYDPGQISALLAATVTAEILALIAAHRRDQRAPPAGPGPPSGPRQEARPLGQPAIDASIRAR